MGEPEYKHAEVVYHANTKEKIEEFIQGKLIISCHPNDDYWLGEGMYFWDNKDNAIFWNKRRHDDKHTSIAKSQLSFDESDLIDLLDRSVRSILRKQIQEICNVVGIDFDLYKNKPGAALNLLFNYLKTVNEKTFKVVKGAGYYKNQPTYSLIVDNDNIKQAHVTGKIKLIYCVRDDNLLSLKQVDD